jgi:hypothetical protein
MHIHQFKNACQAISRSFSREASQKVNFPNNIERLLQFSGKMVKWLQAFIRQRGKRGMKRSIAAAILFWGVLWGIAEATIYQYVDDQGEVHYTNELSSVPADKLDQVTQMKETESDPQQQQPAEYSGPIYPLLQQSPSAEALAAQRDQLQRKQQLEAEYQALLKEKEALDNDKSFQTRRHKRKYQNRPYIKELVEKEARINQRLGDLKLQLEAF